MCKRVYIVTGEAKNKSYFACYKFLIMPFSNLLVFVDIQHPFTLLCFCTRVEKNIDLYALTPFTTSIFVNVHFGERFLNLRFCAYCA